MAIQQIGGPDPLSVDALRSGTDIGTAAAFGIANAAVQQRMQRDALDFQREVLNFQREQLAGNRSEIRRYFDALQRNRMNELKTLTSTLADREKTAREFQKEQLTLLTNMLERMISALPRNIQEAIQPDTTSLPITAQPQPQAQTREALLDSLPASSEAEEPAVPQPTKPQAVFSLPREGSRTVGVATGLAIPIETLVPPDPDKIELDSHILGMLASDPMVGPYGAGQTKSALQALESGKPLTSIDVQLILRYCQYLVDAGLAANDLASGKADVKHQADTSVGRWLRRQLPIRTGVGLRAKKTAEMLWNRSKEIQMLLGRRLNENLIPHYNYIAGSLAAILSNMPTNEVDSYLASLSEPLRALVINEGFKLAQRPRTK